MVRCYFLILSLLMAPAMVLPMGLGLEDGPEVVDVQAEQKRAAQEVQSQAATATPSLFDLCKQELLQNGIPGETSQEKEANTATILNLEANLRTDLGSLFVPENLFPLVATKVDTIRCNGSIEMNRNRTRAIAYTTNIAASEENKIVRVYNITEQSTAPIHLYTLEHSNMVRSAKFNDDGTRIATTSILDYQLDSVHVWNAHDGKLLYSFSPNTRINDVTFNPTNNDQIIVACSDKAAHICDIKKKQVLRTLHHPSIVYARSENAAFEYTDVASVAFAPNGNLVATALEYCVFLWNPHTGEILYTLKNDYTIKKLAFSANSHRLLTASQTGIIVWNVSTQERVCAFRANYSQEIIALALNADGSQAISGCRGEVYIWDTNTGKTLYILPHKTKHHDYYSHHYINSVSFVRHNNDQISVNTDEGRWIWNISALKKLVQGDITPEQHKLLNLIAEEFEKNAHHYWLRSKYYNMRENFYGTANLGIFVKNIIKVVCGADHSILNNENNYFDRPAKNHPLDLSILARKNNIPLRELRAALDSFDPEIRDYIIKKYNIKTDWLYWSTRPAIVYTAAGVALAGLSAYLGWKHFKK